MSKKPNDLAGRILDIIFVPLALLVLLPFFAVVVAIQWLRGRWLRFRWGARYGRIGKRILLVYSESPNWQAHIESNWLPALEGSCVVLNWSKRSRWTRPYPLEVRAFRHWSGDTEFNPMAVLFPSRGKVREVRFWQAFRDFKHGKPGPLEEAEAELFSFAEELRGLPSRIRQ